MMGDGGRWYLGRITDVVHVTDQIHAGRLYCYCAGMLAVLGCVLFAVTLFFYVLLWRTIRRMVHACRADEPSRRFSLFWWLPAWGYHKRRFQESKLRKQIVLGFALTWVFMVSGFALIVAQHFRERCY